MSAFNEFRVAFMGQTRRGKSTLLNALYGTTFKIETIVECTTNINSATFINKDALLPYDAITVMDTPGIGASLESPNDYNPYYNHVFSVANCVVWVTNMQRTDRLDQVFFKNFASEIRKDLHLIVCINGIDKFTPYNMDEKKEVWDNLKNMPTEVLMNAIEARKQLFHEKFDMIIPIPFEITCTNALSGYGLDELKHKIISYGK